MLITGATVSLVFPHKIMGHTVTKCKQKPLRLLNVNCQSIVKKKEEIDHLLYSTKTDIIVGTESWLTPDIKGHEVFPPDFTVYRRDREIGRGGGVFVAVRADVVSLREKDIETECEILWIKLNIASNKNLYIGAYYRSNATDDQSLNSLAQSLAKLPRDRSHVWLAGDMNLPGLEWSSTQLKPACCSPSQHTLFLDILADHGLTQVIDQPTRGDNTLDLLVINNPTLVNRTEILPEISDHNIVFTEIYINPKKYTQTRRKLPCYRKANWEGIERELNRTREYIDTNRETMTANELWNQLIAALNEAVKSHIPHRNASNRDRPPWINGKLKKLIKNSDRLFKKTKKGSKKSKLRTTELQTSKSTIRKETRTAYWIYVDSGITPNQDDHNRNGNKKLWSFIKHRRTYSVGIAPLKENGILMDAPLDKARIPNAQFSSVFTKESPLNTLPQEADPIRQYAPI